MSRATASYAARYGISEALAGRILRAAIAERVDPPLAFGLVSVESAFDPSRTSPGGAIGLTQVLPSTAAKLAPAEWREALRDPDSNLRLGFRLLRDYLDLFPGDRERAVLAYHIGPSGARHPDGLSRSSYPRRVLRAAAVSAVGAR